MHLLELGIAAIGIYIITRQSFDGTAQVDRLLQNYIDKLPMGLHGIFRALAYWFTPENIALAILGIAIWSLLTAQWYILLTSTLVLAGIKATQLMRLVFYRHRPFHLQKSARIQNNFSFPNNHATSSLLLILIIISLFHPPVMLSLGLFIFAAMVGLSHAYLRTHRPTDVIGGWLIAIGVWAVIGMLL